MTPEQQTLIRHRLQMAQETLQDAVLLRTQGGSLWSVANRAYYAMFYATLALLASIGLGASKHSRVIALFDQHFVKTGLLPKEMSRWLHRAFDLRQRGDYWESPALDEQKVEAVLQWAGDFVEQMNTFLQSQMQSDDQ